MNKLLNWLVVIVFVINTIILGGATLSLADAFSFRCKVKNVYELTADGQLVKTEESSYAGMTFSVERSTGKIIGGVFDNTRTVSKEKSDYQMKVIDGSSFKVFTYAESRKVAESLAVRTWQEGNESPFVGIDYLQTVVTGTCD